MTKAFGNTQYKAVVPSPKVNKYGSKQNRHYVIRDSESESESE